MLFTSMKCSGVNLGKTHMFFGKSSAIQIKIKRRCLSKRIFNLIFFLFHFFSFFLTGQWQQPLIRNGFPKGFFHHNFLFITLFSLIFLRIFRIDLIICNSPFYEALLYSLPMSSQQFLPLRKKVKNLIIPVCSYNNFHCLFYFIYFEQAIVD